MSVFYFHATSWVGGNPMPCYFFMCSKQVTDSQYWNLSNKTQGTGSTSQLEKKTHQLPLSQNDFGARCPGFFSTSMSRKVQEIITILCNAWIRPSKLPSFLGLRSLTEPSSCASLKNESLSSDLDLRSLLLHPKKTPHHLQLRLNPNETWWKSDITKLVRCDEKKPLETLETLGLHGA